ncbi:efflux transporter outer membrane subunit [Pseudomonas syringae pv. tagetis]|uniref:Efflux transporter outer membrane subunit n=2 Tax=Pseudomonas syringae group genomosp. 7 TaxID=251699 RepID=A0A0Q0CJX5_9PSED|nr:efflux transporter outer membrane subunit [Pseudomonas syringae group genomosp. 7]KPY88524.1 Outer membrane component of tripartite multidrug resistance system [Pseudomonas syringae pv. tagetis]RMR00216.1 Outer membrane component of tripartite multidrug resistance system [Pseudomonas syringae pv. helianthi]RMV46359.1 Outer membrane component of tripartite multidrug resistance system [Pseudomonas syringae pv. helianthi]RMW23379.1 Outer membrane component of tripartite multidrug resistance sys
MQRRIIRGLKPLGILAFTLVLSGCIETHGIKPHGSVLRADSLATDEAIQRAALDAHWPMAQWWRVYGDAQLDRWIDIATSGSPGLALAAARVRQAKAVAQVAESSEAVQVQSDTSLTRHAWPNDQFYGPGALADTRTWDNNASLGLSYALDLWGRERNATEQALDVAHARAAEQRQAQLELQENVVRAYIQFALNYARLDIAEAALAQQQQMLDLARRRLKGGIGTHFDVSQAETPLPEAHRQIDALQEAIALSRNQLAALAGKGPGEGAALQRPALSLRTELKLPSALPAELLGQRPDVVAARWQVAAQARGIDVAHAGFYPNIDLVGSLSYMATGGGLLEFLTGSKLSYKAGPAISLPIFDGGRLRAELGQASAAYDQAVAHYNQTLVMALKSISDQLIRRASMDKQQAFAAESVASAQKTYDIALIAWQRGLTDYLNVLNARTQLFRQQQIQQQVEAARLNAYAGLVVALGGDNRHCAGAAADRACAQ